MLNVQIPGQRSNYKQSRSRRMTVLRNVGIVVGCIAIIIGCYFSLVKFYPSCHTAFVNPTHYTATKSPYLFTTSGTTNTSDECSAHQIWMLVRHGTRTPGPDLIQEIKATMVKTRNEIILNHEKGLGSLCGSEVDKLKSWDPFPNVKDTDNKILMPQGVKEMAGIASRYQTRFPNLFLKQYNNESFHFKYTKTERTKDSADAFTSALFDEQSRQEIKYPEPVKADPILRFYKDCPKWGKGVNKNPETYKEQNLFVQSAPFQEMLTRITGRLGFQTNISKELTILMYQACVFETAFTPETHSPWCVVFAENDLQVLEYYQDLDYYWVDGYGHEISYQVACPAVMDMIQHFENRVESKTVSPNVIAYFTHSGTMLKFLARLGLFQDKEHLRSDNFHSNFDRKWRTSRIDPFATNLGIVLYKCPKDYQIGMLFQEHEVPIPYCNDKLRCPYEEFRKKISEIIGDKCDNAKICQFKEEL